VKEKYDIQYDLQKKYINMFFINYHKRIYFSEFKIPIRIKHKERNSKIIKDIKIIMENL
jgi:hypothetical protein